MKVYEFNPDAHKARLRELYMEYVTWMINEINANSDLNFESEVIAKFVEDDMQTLDKFLPPNGHILLVEIDGQIVGTGSMRWSGDDAAEFKRMYVTPAYRGQGIGERLINDLLEFVMGKMECKFVRLETFKFMKSAHKIYRSYGFYEIEQFEGSEVPPMLLPLSLFMELFVE